MTSNKAVFTEGSLFRHMVVMTCTSATSLLSIFLVDILTVVYIAMLRDDSLLAAIAVAKTLMFFITSMVLGVAVAAGTVVSKRLGAGAPERARQLASTGLLLAVIVAAAGALIQLVFLDVAVHLLGAEGSAFAAASSYLWITLPATVLMAVGQLCAQLLRTAGLSRQAMWIMLIATAAVAVADPVLIFLFDLGLDGAGYAYVLSCTITASAGGYYVHRVARLTSPLEARQLWADIGHISRIAVPAVFGNLATPVGMAYLMATVAQFGSQALAGIAVVDRVIQFAFCVFFVLPGALSPVLGQNLGAMNKVRAAHAIRMSYGLVVVYGVSVSLLLAVSAGLMGRLFHVEGEGLLILEAFCRFGGVLWTIIGLQFIATSIFITMGRSIYVTVFGWLRASLGTVPFVWYGAQTLGSSGALLGQLLGNALVALLACGVAMAVMRNALNELDGPSPAAVLARR
ncbi:MATE family efflux transporter [Pseudomonas sp. PWP3-1b2]|uniref:MATE family efflux transporter n=1 Tax=Pseudomonas sp. PWP3-1b2 TaxID=2804656 RepID=UPI003CF78F18